MIFFMIMKEKKKNSVDISCHLCTIPVDLSIKYNYWSSEEGAYVVGNQELGKNFNCTNLMSYGDVPDIKY